MSTTGDPKRLRPLALVAQGVPVCLDSSEENMVVALALNAQYLLDGTWNGWARPVATKIQFIDFLTRWKTNDPHGTWGDAHETADGLQYDDAEGNDPELFQRVGTSEDGLAMYDLTGWVWVRITP